MLRGRRQKAHPIQPAQQSPSPPGRAVSPVREAGRSLARQLFAVPSRSNLNTGHTLRPRPKPKITERGCPCVLGHTPKPACSAQSPARCAEGENAAGRQSHTPFPVITTRPTSSSPRHSLRHFHRPRKRRGPQQKPSVLPTRGPFSAHPPAWPEGDVSLYSIGCETS